MPLTELLPVAVFAISYALDPRKVRTGLYLLLALFWAVFSIVGWLSGWMASIDEFAAAVVIVVAIGLGLVTVVGFAGFLIVAGIALLRHEGYALAHILGIAVAADVGGGRRLRARGYEDAEERSLLDEPAHLTPARNSTGSRRSRSA